MWQAHNQYGNEGKVGHERLLLRQMGLRNVARVNYKVRREERRGLLGAWRRKMLQTKYGPEFSVSANPKAHFFDDWIHHVSLWEEKWRHVDVVAQPSSLGCREASALVDASLCKAMEQVGVATMEVERALRLRGELGEEVEGGREELSKAALTARESAEAAVFQAQEARSYAEPGQLAAARAMQGATAWGQGGQLEGEPCTKQTAVGAMAQVLERAIAEHSQLLRADIGVPPSRGGNPYGTVMDGGSGAGDPYGASMAAHTDYDYIARQERLRAELLASGELDFLHQGTSQGTSQGSRQASRRPSSRRSSAWSEDSSVSPFGSPPLSPLGEQRRFSNEFSTPPVYSPQAEMASPPHAYVGAVEPHRSALVSRSASLDLAIGINAISDVESALLSLEKEFGLG